MELLSPAFFLGLALGIIVIGFLADKIIFSPWERFLHRRWGLAKS